MLNNETIKDLVYINSVMPNNYLKNKKDSIQFKNDNRKKPENFKRNYYFLSIDGYCEAYDLIKEIAHKGNLKIYTINNYSDFSDYKDQNAIALNIPYVIDIKLFNCIFKFLNLKDSELDYIQTDLILSQYFENFFIISFNKFEELKYSISKKFIGYLRVKVIIYGKVGEKNRK